jgi:hypothetical protein
MEVHNHKVPKQQKQGLTVVGLLFNKIFLTILLLQISEKLQHFYEAKK